MLPKLPYQPTTISSLFGLIFTTVILGVMESGIQGDELTILEG
jgi:hypothetical protein